MNRNQLYDQLYTSLRNIPPYELDTGVSLYAVYNNYTHSASIRVENYFQFHEYPYEVSVKLRTKYYHEVDLDDTIRKLNKKAINKLGETLC